MLTLVPHHATWGLNWIIPLHCTIKSGKGCASMSQYSIFPIGDSAVTIELGNYISQALNKKVISMQQWLQRHPFEGLQDIIVAYSSLSVIYNAAVVKAKCKPGTGIFPFVRQILTDAFEKSFVTENGHSPLVHMPVCYDTEFGFDMEFVAAEKQLSMEEVIRLHTGRIYRVFMIGFLPGFPYMATVDEKLVTRRKDSPRALVPAGSVGLAEHQTGIYPLDSPGGWQIIGRCPYKLFDKANGNFLRLNAGDSVQFYSITREEFNGMSH
jgi:inhibitor of KinA